MVTEDSAALAGVAVLLILGSRSRLVGEGIRPETARRVRELALAHPEIDRVAAPLSMYLGPDAVLLTLDAQFRSGTRAEDIARAVASLEREVRGEFPLIRHIYIAAARGCSGFQRRGAANQGAPPRSPRSQ